MSDSPRRSSGDFAKKVQRQLSRGKEKVTVLHDVLPLMLHHSDTLTYPFPLLLLQVLQKLGKSAETRDSQFDLCLQLFMDQQVIKFVIDGKKQQCVFHSRTDLDACTVDS